MRKKVNKRAVVWVVGVILLVIVLVCIFRSSKGDESFFEIDSILFKGSMNSEGNLSGEVRVINKGDSSDLFFVSSYGLEDFVEFGVSEFSLDSGEVQKIVLNFSNSNQKEEGVYVGGLSVESSFGEKILPLILDIEDKEPFFDCNIEVFPTGKIHPGDDVGADVSVYNLLQEDRADVDLIYFLRDFDENLILTDSTDVVFNKDVELERSVDIPRDLEEGDYVLGVLLDYGDSQGVCSAFFRVEKKRFFESISQTPILYLIVIFSLVFIFLIVFIFYFIYSNDRLLKELRNQYRSELKRKERVLGERESEVEKRLETAEEKRASKKIFRGLKKATRKRMKEIQGGRMKEFKKLKKSRKKGDMASQIAKWKRKGYDTSVLDKKVPSVRNIKKQIAKWKRKGYDTKVLEKNI